MCLQLDIWLQTKYLISIVSSALKVILKARYLASCVFTYNEFFCVVFKTKFFWFFSSNTLYSRSCYRSSRLLQPSNCLDNSMNDLTIFALKACTPFLFELDWHRPKHGVLLQPPTKGEGLSVFLFLFHASSFEKTHQTQERRSFPWLLALVYGCR